MENFRVNSGTGGALAGATSGSSGGSVLILIIFIVVGLFLVLTSFGDANTISNGGSALKKLMGGGKKYRKYKK